MKQLFTLIALTFLFQSCLDLRSCPDGIEGKYICKNNPNAQNYLMLNSNGTFEHFYKENSTKLIHKGTWKKSSNGFCQIEFNEWNNYNQQGKNFKSFGSGILFISNRNLDEGPDGESSESFVKI